MFNVAKSWHVYTFDEAINYRSAEEISHYTGFPRAGERHGSAAAADENMARRHTPDTDTHLRALLHRRCIAAINLRGF